MTPEQLLTFAIVAEHGNISLAARALCLSQPAVSGQLKLLQEEFGEPLYRRAGRGIRLTDAGRQLAVYGDALRAGFRSAQAYRDRLRGMESGTLSIAASTTPASYLLPHLIAAFQQRHPGVTLKTFDANSAEVVASLATVDIAMIEGPVPAELSPDVGVVPWRRDEIVAVVPTTHALAGRGEAGTSLEALSAYPLILRESGSGVRQTLESAFTRCGAPIRVGLYVSGVEAVKEAVRAGMGVGFVSAMSMRHEDALLTSLRVDPPRGLTRQFTILVPHASSLSWPTRVFLEICQGLSAGLPGEAAPEAPSIQDGAV